MTPLHDARRAVVGARLLVRCWRRHLAQPDMPAGELEVVTRGHAAACEALRWSHAWLAEVWAERDRVDQRLEELEREVEADEQRHRTVVPIRRGPT